MKSVNAAKWEEEIKIKKKKFNKFNQCTIILLRKLQKDAKVMKATGAMT